MRRYGSSGMFTVNPASRSRLMICAAVRFGRMGMERVLSGSELGREVGDGDAADVGARAPIAGGVPGVRPCPFAGHGVPVVGVGLRGRTVMQGRPVT
ncbi:hypothetical protein GCM10023259_019710 [Thermocatellispora tengchongensis]